MSLFPLQGGIVKSQSCAIDLSGLLKNLDHGRGATGGGGGIKGEGKDDIGVSATQGESKLQRQVLAGTRSDLLRVGNDGDWSPREQYRVRDECGVTGGAYVIADDTNRRYVFKPADEEGYTVAAAKEGGSLVEKKIPKRNGITYGLTSLKETAAYMLDHQRFAGVPPTYLVRALSLSSPRSVTSPSPPEDIVPSAVGIKEHPQKAMHQRPSPHSPKKPSTPHSKDSSSAVATPNDPETNLAGPSPLALVNAPPQQNDGSAFLTAVAETPDREGGEGEEEEVVSLIQQKSIMVDDSRERLDELLDNSITELLGKIKRRREVLKALLKARGPDSLPHLSKMPLLTRWFSYAPPQEEDAIIFLLNRALRNHSRSFRECRRTWGRTLPVCCHESRRNPRAYAVLISTLSIFYIRDNPFVVARDLCPRSDLHRFRNFTNHQNSPSSLGSCPYQTLWIKVPQDLIPVLKGMEIQKLVRILSEKRQEDCSPKMRRRRRPRGGGEREQSLDKNDNPASSVADRKEGPHLAASKQKGGTQHWYECRLFADNNPCIRLVKQRFNVSQNAGKVGSVQAYVSNVGSADEYGSSAFDRENVHRIGILDIRLFNMDRHLGNLLVSPCKGGGDEELGRGGGEGKEATPRNPALAAVDMEFGDSVSTSTESSSVSRSRQHGDDKKKAKKTRKAATMKLVPIDHAYTLPNFRQLSDANFEWLYWRQAREPFSEETKDYVLSLDPFFDASVLIRLGIPEECAITVVITTLFLQRCVSAGMTLSEIGDMIQRQGVGESPSVLENIVSEALLEHEEAIGRRKGASRDSRQCSPLNRGGGLEEEEEKGEEEGYVIKRIEDHSSLHEMGSSTSSFQATKGEADDVKSKGSRSVQKRRLLMSRFLSEKTSQAKLPSFSRTLSIQQCLGHSKRKLYPIAHPRLLRPLKTCEIRKEKRKKINFSKGSGGRNRLAASLFSQEKQQKIASRRRKIMGSGAFNSMQHDALEMMLSRKHRIHNEWDLRWNRPARIFLCITSRIIDRTIQKIVM
eukprot:jgi/Bigna1/81320/fgenesh1_pg.79_\